MQKKTLSSNQLDSEEIINMNIIKSINYETISSTKHYLYLFQYSQI